MLSLDLNAERVRPYLVESNVILDVGSLGLRLGVIPGWQL